MLFVVANERHNDLDGRPLCGGGAEEVLGALEGRSHVIPRDFVRLLVSLQTASAKRERGGEEAPARFMLCSAARLRRIMPTSWNNSA